MFVSTVDGIKDRPCVISYDSYKMDEASREKKQMQPMGLIEFVSLKGAKAFGGQYGLAPTEIIYKIATNYILGFATGNEDIVHNFRQLDALPYVQNGTLQEKLDELFGK